MTSSNQVPRRKSKKKTAMMHWVSRPSAGTLRLCQAGSFVLRPRTSPARAAVCRPEADQRGSKRPRGLRCRSRFSLGRNLNSGNAPSAPPPGPERVLVPHIPFRADECPIRLPPTTQRGPGEGPERPAPWKPATSSPSAQASFAIGMAPSRGTSSPAARPILARLDASTSSAPHHNRYGELSRRRPRGWRRSGPKCAWRQRVRR